MLRRVSGSRQNGPFDVVAVIGSLGSLLPLRTVLGHLPPDFPAAVIVVQHRTPGSGSRLAELLSRYSAVPARPAFDGDPVLPGVVHVAPAEATTLVGPDRRFRLLEGRCVGDPLLVSVADVYGPRALAVVLSGRLRDGADGLRRIKAAGGRGLVQAPETCEAAEMPVAAMATGAYDFALGPDRIGEALVTLVTVAGAAELLAVRPHPLVAGV